MCAARRLRPSLGEMERMPKGPRGEIRPADLVGCAVKVARLSVGDETECLTQKSGRVRSGIAGAAARDANTTKEQRAEIARKASGSRWR